jgi:hypothetical protein
MIGFQIIMLYLCGVGKPRLSLLMTVFIMDSRDIPVPMGPHVNHFIEDIRVASWYQDKEVKNESRINEANTSKDLIPEISAN